jgi:hypothetical protein
MSLSRLFHLHGDVTIFWLTGSLKDEFSMTLPYFCNYHPFEEDLVLYLNNCEFPLSKEVLYQV